MSRLSARVVPVVLAAAPCLMASGCCDSCRTCEPCLCDDDTMPVQVRNLCARWSLRGVSGVSELPPAGVFIDGVSLGDEAYLSLWLEPPDDRPAWQIRNVSASGSETMLASGSWALSGDELTLTVYGALGPRAVMRATAAFAGAGSTLILTLLDSDYGRTPTGGPEWLPGAVWTFDRE